MLFLATVILSSCANFSQLRIDNELVEVLPDIPTDIKICFSEAELVQFPNKSFMTKRDLKSLITNLRKSEVEKHKCGLRLIAYYEGLQSETLL